MNDFDKLYGIIIVLMAVSLILTYIFDWMITRNGFQVMSSWFMFLCLGLMGGRTLTLKEVKK